MNARGMDDEAIYAFNPVPPAPPAPPPRAPRRRALWPWVLGALLLLAVAGTVAAGLALWSAAQDAGDAVRLVIDDEPWAWDVADGALGFLGVVFGLGVALLVVMVVVPCVLMVALLAVVLAVGLALGGVLLALAVVAAVLLSPLLLAGALLWWLLRPRRRPAATMAP